MSPRKQAIANGDTHYNSGKPCKRGHTSDRKTNDAKCSECQGITARQLYSKNRAINRGKREQRRIETEQEAKKYRAHKRLQEQRTRYELARKKAEAKRRKDADKQEANNVAYLANQRVFLKQQRQENMETNNQTKRTSPLPRRRLN